MNNTDEAVQFVKEQFSRIGLCLKAAMGVSNSLVKYAMLDALDKLQADPRYKQTLKVRFKLAKKAFDDYELNLLHAKEVRLFHVADMPENERKKYKTDLTDREYFELWQDMYASAYDHVKQQLVVYRYKYQKLLRQEGYKDNELLSYLVTVTALTELSMKTFESLTAQLSTKMNIRLALVRNTFKGFYLSKPYDAWLFALKMIFPECAEFGQKAIACRDIELGKQEFERVVSNQFISSQYIGDGIADNKELYSTKKQYYVAMEKARNIEEKNKDSLIR